MKAQFARAHDVRRDVADIIQPPSRQLPSDAAAENLRTEKGAWNPELTPELCEPLNQLASRKYQGVVFVGPARTGKSMSLVLGGITYVVTCAPGDMLVVQMSQDSARDFSRIELDRAIRHSPALSMRLSPRAKDDNTYDKFFRSGAVLKIGWPAISQLSSKTLKYVWLMDYDRPQNRDNIDGEGPMWELAAKRIETFMSRGKCIAESSPGEDFTDPQWKARTNHEAPPTRGILSLYNRGTRARLYWPCQHCGFYFQAEPGLGNFVLPSFEKLEKIVATKNLMTVAAEYSRVACPDCGGLHEMDQRPAMKSEAVWLHDGQRIDRLKRIYGDPPDSQIASYWLGTAAAAYQRWDRVVLKYLQGVQNYYRTGSEDDLRATTYTDQAIPYKPRAILNKRSSDDLFKRAQKEEFERGVVPRKARFLVAAVDVQKHRFVVQVYAFGKELESWLIDRYEITSSLRPEGDRFAAIDPAVYREDWDILIDEVIEREFKVEGLEGTLKPLTTVCDSGGQAGVTERAYETWRTFRKRGYAKPKKGGRFRLIKGVGRINTPRVKETWPDKQTGRSARKSRARGDVPVWLLNTNVWKDAVAGDLGRATPGPGYVHLANWLDPTVFDEYTAETRSDKGWIQPRGVPNEAFDLHVYARSACLMIGAERINWDKPPAWAEDLEKQLEKKPEPAPETKKKQPAKRSGQWVQNRNSWMNRR